jgi:acid phosphatase type 7
VNDPIRSLKRVAALSLPLVLAFASLVPVSAADPRTDDPTLETLGPGDGLVSDSVAGSASDPTVWAAGDLSRVPGGVLNPQIAVSNIAAKASSNWGVLVLGDTQYGQAQLSEYNGSFACGMGWPDTTCSSTALANWGRVVGSMYTSPGDHEWKSGSISDYITWFSDAANGHAEHPPGPGTASAAWYSFTIGTWHWLSLDSTCFSNAHGCQAAESSFIKDDLANLDHARYPCIGVIMSEPRFASGIKHGSDATLGPLWDLLMPGGSNPDGANVYRNADLILAGHEHNYERFAIQDSSGTATSAGIREFVVGTGGAAHDGLPFGGKLGSIYDPGCHTDGCTPYPSECIQDFGQADCSGTPIANSQIGNDNTFGMLELKLQASAYLWKFVPTADPSFGVFPDPLDGGFGSHACHA